MKLTNRFVVTNTALSPNRLSMAVRWALFGLSLPISATTAMAELTLDQTQTVITASDAAQTTDAPSINVADAEMPNLTTPQTNDASIVTQPDDANQQTAEQTESAVSEQMTQTEKAKPSVKDSVLQKIGLGKAQSASLAKLAENYHANLDASQRCQGVWITPQQSQNLQNASTFNGMRAEADYGYWDAHEYAELSGNVIIEQNGQQVFADKATFNTRTGQAKIEGQVQFSDQVTADGKGIGMMGVAQSIEYGSNDGTAVASDVAFASTAINAHGHAGSMQKINDSQYQLDQVMFTTCPPTERKWHLDAERIDINSDTGRAVAKHSTLRISDVPVLYLPYFNFPIDERRATGFLLPSIGIGSSDAIELSTPYYLNLSPNYDATITPTIFVNRNPMITGEFRYLTKNLGSGTLNASYLPHDRQYQDKDRSRIRYDHHWQSERLKNLTGYINYQHVSDADYLHDFDNLGLETRSLNLPRRFGWQYYSPNVSAELRFEDFQRLHGVDITGKTISDKDRPYARLPQLSIDYRLPKSWLGLGDKVEITGVHNTAYFKKSIKDNSEPEKSGLRTYNQLSASYAWLRPWGYATPKLSLTHLYTSYDEDSLNDQNLDKKEGSQSIFAPQFSLDTGLFLEKAGAPFGIDKEQGGYQVLSPRLKYTYTPYRNQTQLPNFETVISNISYNQLLADLWFLGYDRIQDLHAITPAINYRYIDGQGLVRFDGSLAQQFFLDDLKVGIDNSEQFTGNHSGMAWQASIQPKQNLWLDTSGALDPDYGINTVIGQIRYQPDAQRLFNVGIIERKPNPITNQQALSAYTASAILPISNRWRVMGQMQYDYRHKLLLDSLVGVNYEDCCYGLSVYARRYRDGLNPQASVDTAIMAELRLNGITSGGRLNRLLSDKVMGYDNVQNAWQQNQHRDY